MQQSAEPAAATGDELGPRVRLDQLTQRVFGLVADIEAPDDDTARLMSLGVCAGRLFELVKTGDPLILRVFATRIGLSARLAARVYVRPFTGERQQRRRRRGRDAQI
jgi:Fe2+ transport system protein FeoA